MGASIDLSKAHHSQQYGDLLAIYSWINDERALFLIPHRRKGAPWYVVMEPAAHTWSDQSEWSNIPAVIAKAQKACEVLGIEPSQINVRRIIGIVNDAIPTLLRMPHAPEREKYSASFGQMRLNADGKTIAHEEIRLEKEGAQYA